MVPCIFPIVIIIITLNSIAALNGPATTMQLYLMSLYLIFIVILMILGISLLEVTNEDSISGMVAQRYNKVSYLTILIITGISFFTSAFIISGGITREKTHKSINEPVVVVAGKTGIELRMLPQDVHRILPDPPRALSPAEYKYKLTFFKGVSTGWHKIFHFLAVSAGVSTGYASVVSHLVDTGANKQTSWILELIILILSGVCLFCFILAGKFTDHDASPNWKRFILFIEFLGLYFYMISIIYTSAIAGDLIHQ